jgi:type IV secretion system protein VirB10
MCRPFFRLVLAASSLLFCSVGQVVFAQEPPSSAAATEKPSPVTPDAASPALPVETAASKPLAAKNEIIVPAGTRLPLILRNGINTRVARAGDAVYFETLYPIAANNRIAIPMGTFVRGEILEAKRPGRIHGRGEFRIALEQMTFPNGYTIDLRATPTAVDRDGQEGVTPGGRVTGPSGVGKDVGTVALATALGGPVGGYAGLLAGHASRGSVAIGHGVGLAAGLAVVLLTRGPEAELPRGTTIDAIFDRSLILDAALLPTNIGAGVDPLLRNIAAPVDERKHQREVHERRLARQPLFWPFLLRPF